MNTGSVAVCIPTYNQSGYLREAVESVLAQSVGEVPVYISDDASTDDTETVCRELQERHPQIRVFRQPRNLGIAGNTDRVMRQPAEDFVLRLDSDDRLKPEALGLLCRTLEENATAGYAHGAVQQIDERGRPRHLRILARPPGYQDAETALRAGLRGYRVAANIVMFRRTALEQAGYLTGRPDYVEDYHLSVDLARKGWGNVYSDAIVAEYRVWMDGKRLRASRKGMELVGVRRTFDEVLTPAYAERGWNSSPLDGARQALAVQHARTLGEQSFSPEERAKLEADLRALSRRPVARAAIRLYGSAVGPALCALGRRWDQAKIVVKTMLRAMRDRHRRREAGT